MWEIFFQLAIKIEVRTLNKRFAFTKIKFWRKKKVVYQRAASHGQTSGGF